MTKMPIIADVPTVRRRSLKRLVLATTAFAALGLVATTRAATPEPRIFDVAGGRFVAEPALVGALAEARYRLLGEMHDNAEHHVLRARLVREIVARGRRPAIVLEQFDLDRDEGLRDAQRRGADANALAEAGALDRTAWRWPLHRPIIEAAVAGGLPVRAGNASRAQLRSDQRLPAAWQRRIDEARWSDAQAVALREEIVDAHCGKLPDSVAPRLVQSQRVRDAAMAQAVVDAATVDGAILIAGNGHVRADLAVPVYLPRGTAIGVGFIESETLDDAALQRIAAKLAGRFDYLWFTSTVARDDPCAGIR